MKCTARTRRPFGPKRCRRPATRGELCWQHARIAHGNVLARLAQRRELQVYLLRMPGASVGFGQVAPICGNVERHDSHRWVSPWASTYRCPGWTGGPGRG